MNPIQNRAPKHSKWQNFTPHKVAFKACLLADDLIHRGVTRTAEKIEKTTGLTRKGLSYAVVGAGIVTSAIASYNNPDISSQIYRNVFFGIGAGYFVRVVPDWPSGSPKTSDLAKTEDKFFGPVEKLIKVIRFPLLVWAAGWAAYDILGGERTDLSSQIRNMAGDMLFYLFSSSTGILDRVLKSLKHAKEKLVSAPSPVPEPHSELINT
jgi:hypothetical protein